MMLITVRHGIIVQLVCGVAQANPKDGALYEAVAQHILEPGVSAGFNHIDLSNIWWACGIMGLNPCAGRLYPLLAQEAINRAPVMNQQVLEMDFPFKSHSMDCLIIMPESGTSREGCSVPHRMHVCALLDGVSQGCILRSPLAHTASSMSDC